MNDGDGQYVAHIAIDWAATVRPHAPVIVKITRAPSPADRQETP